MEKERRETRIVQDTLDMNLLKWRVEVDGLDLMVKGLKEKKLLGRKCHQCGTVYLPGTSLCRKCFIDIHEVVEVGPKGTIASFTVNLADVRGNPVQEPTVTVDVKLDGSDSWLMGTLQIDDWKKVYVGMRVEAVLKEEPSGALADLECFQPSG